MDPETVPSQDPTPGTAGTWSRRRRLTLGLTALALVAGGGVAIAAGSPDDPQVAVGVGKLAVPAKGDLRGGILHSEAVSSDGNGGYVTHLTQVGKIESVDADNLTVVSDDGYKRAWKRTSDTVVGGANWSVTKNDDGSWTVRKATEELASGQQVLVIGTLSGDEATAQRIAAQPEAGDLPPGILKRFGGEEGSDAAGKLKQRMMERFGGEAGGMPGPMGGSGGEVRKFEFRTGPNGESGTVTAPAPGESFGKGGAIPAPSAPEAPDSSATPVEPSSAHAGSGSVSFT
jgi:hypothetical protein